MMQRRVQQGVSARIELELIENRIFQEKNNYYASEEQQKIAAARLEQIVGQPISKGGSMSIPDLGVLVRQARIDSAGFEEKAFNHVSFYNPTVVKSAYEIASAKEAVKIQRAALYPEVYLNFDYDYYHKDDRDDTEVSIGASYSPGAGFSNYAKTRASQAQVASLNKSREAARRSVMEDIQTQYEQYVHTKNQEAALVAEIAGDQKVLDSYRRQFKAGRKSWLEVLNQVREMSNNKAALVQTRAEMLGAFYNLQIAFGEMPWQEFQQNREPTVPFHPIQPLRELVSDPQLQNYNVQKADSDVLITETSFSTDKQINTEPTFVTYKIDANQTDIQKVIRNGEDDDITLSDETVNSNTAVQPLMEEASITTPITNVTSNSVLNPQKDTEQFIEFQKATADEANPTTSNVGEVSIDASGSNDGFVSNNSTESMTDYKEMTIKDIDTLIIEETRY